MKICFTLLFLFSTFLMNSQEQYVLSFDKFQMVENSSTALKSQIRFPVEDSVVILGGLNDLDGMGNYFNIYGGKLLVDSMKITSTGEHALILRREDGKDFYNLFPTLSARLIPITQEKQEKPINLN